MAGKDEYKNAIETITDAYTKLVEHLRTKNELQDFEILTFVRATYNIVMTAARLMTVVQVTELVSTEKARTKYVLRLQENNLITQLNEKEKELFSELSTKEQEGTCDCCPDCCTQAN